MTTSSTATRIVSAPDDMPSENQAQNMGIRQSASRSRIWGIALLALPVALALSLPLLGAAVSLFLPLIAGRVGHRLWPGASRRAVHVCSALTVLGLWLPALLLIGSQGIIAVLGSGTVWLLIPLCAPAGLAALLMPAVLATGVSVLGSVVSVGVRHPWPWTVAAWLAPMAYDIAAHWVLPNAFLC